MDLSPVHGELNKINDFFLVSMEVSKNFKSFRELSKIQKQSLGGVQEKSVPKYFAKFIWKHLL